MPIIIGNKIVKVEELKNKPILPPVLPPSESNLNKKPLPPIVEKTKFFKKLSQYQLDMMVIDKI